MSSEEFCLFSLADGWVDGWMIEVSYSHDGPGCVRSLSSNDEAKEE